MALILRGSDNLDSADIVKDSTCESDIVPYNKGFKNYIINGNFDIWQRGNSQTATSYGSDDRWNNSHKDSTKMHSHWIWEKYSRNVLVLKDLTVEEFNTKYGDIILAQEEARLNINKYEQELLALETKGAN